MTYNLIMQREAGFRRGKAGGRSGRAGPQKRAREAEEEARMGTGRKSAESAGRRERFQKEDGLGRGLMNSIALFVYHAYPNGTGKRDAVDVFNEWARGTGARFDDADAACAALEHVRMTMNVSRDDLAAALSLDGLAGNGGEHGRHQG